MRQAISTHDKPALREVVGEDVGDSAVVGALSQWSDGM